MPGIPKIIHQLWIGDKPAPITLMNTWKDKHPDFEYIMWNENEMIKRNFQSQLNNKINEIEEICGKADILRWEILYKYGGIFIDADSFCIEPIDKLLELNKSFTIYENEIVRGVNWCNNNPMYDDVLARTHSLIAIGAMAFSPNHEIPKMAIEWIKNNEVSFKKVGKRPWRVTGPGLLTRIYYSKKWDDMIILPSYYFLPIHATGTTYHGHGKVYSHQEWGSTHNTYDIMNTLSLPSILLPPDSNNSVSILITSYNTNIEYIQDCLDSIKNQTGHFNIEVVWIDDGSELANSIELKKKLDDFISSTRFTTLIYHKNETNMKLPASLNIGLLLCNNEIIIRMDSDDIMAPNRIDIQFNFMKNHPHIHICGGQVQMFRNNINNIIDITKHPIITWDKYKLNISHWIANHPTLCYRKQSVIDIGKYNTEYNVVAEDLDLELRMLKKYKILFNFREILLYYRLHQNNLTNNLKKNPEHWNNLRLHIINNIISDK
jgi:hypothetical protein